MKIQDSVARSTGPIGCRTGEAGKYSVLGDGDSNCCCASLLSEVARDQSYGVHTD